MNPTTTKYLVLISLILLFIAPGIGALYFYQHPQMLHASKTNKGFLLEQPVAIASLKSEKWALVLWEPKKCGASCIADLETLAKVRLALGRKLYEVDQRLLIEEQNVKSDLLHNQLQNLDFKLAAMNSIEKNNHLDLFKNRTIFIADPQGFIILKYQTVNPDDIYKDLKLLLNTSNKS